MQTASPDPAAIDLRSADDTERERAWRQLFDIHYDRIYRLVCRFGVDAGEIEDLAQRAFVTAYQRIQEVDDVREPGAWLRGIVVKVVAHHRRWQKVREVKRWLLNQAPAAMPGPIASPERSVQASEEIEAVREVLCRLSHKLRDVLVLCDIEELPLHEVAELLEVPVNTVRSRRRIAREKFLSLWTAQHGGAA